LIHIKDGARIDVAAQFAARQICAFFRLGNLLCWSWDLIVDNPSPFSEGLARVRKLHRLGQLQPIFIVYRHNEAGLPPEIEPMEFVKHGLEDHGLRSHAALNAAMASSLVAS
jgi:hypothetical protein